MDQFGPLKRAALALDEKPVRSKDHCGLRQTVMRTQKGDEHVQMNEERSAERMELDKKTSRLEIVRRIIPMSTSLMKMTSRTED